MSPLMHPFWLITCKCLPGLWDRDLIVRPRTACDTQRTAVGALRIECGTYTARRCVVYTRDGILSLLMTVVSVARIGRSANSGLPHLVTLPVSVRLGRGIIVHGF